MIVSSGKPGPWQTVKSAKEEKKKRSEAKKETKTDRLGVPIDPSAAALAAFDRAYEKQAAARADKERGYTGAFAGLVDEAPPAQLQHEPDSSGEDEAGAGAGASRAAPAKPKAPKAPKKPKLSVGQVAAGIDVAVLQSWMAEVQQRYSANETAQLQALSDRLLSIFKEASLDLAKLVATKGVDAASAAPLADVPHALLNALASFVASLSEPALVQVTVPLVVSAVTEAAGAGAGQGPPGKGKAGLFITLAVVLRTRPQVLVQAAGELRRVGRVLSGAGRLPLLLWVINQAALADAAAGVAVWVRLLLPQLLGVAEAAPPTAAGAGGKAGGAKVAAAAGVDAQQLLQPLDTGLQAAALDYLAGLLQQLGAVAGARGLPGDVTCGDGELEPVVPGAAVELVSRVVAGRAWDAAPAAAAGKGGAAAAATGGGESKKAAAARAAAASGLEPLLPGLSALAASSSCGSHYSDWLLLILESAGLSGEAPDAPDALVSRSAASAVACVAGSEAACCALWQSKHKHSLRGSARVLAALVKQPALLRPLLERREAAAAFRALLAELPARHRTYLAAGKGWQGACARVAEDAAAKLPRKLGRGGWGGGAATVRGGGGGGAGTLLAVLGAGGALAVVTASLYRREVGGIVTAYAGADAAQQLDALLVPLEAGVRQGLAAAQPYIAQAQAAAAPAVSAAWDNVQPLAQQAHAALEPVAAQLQQLAESGWQQLQELLAKQQQ